MMVPFAGAMRAEQTDVNRYYTFGLDLIMSAAEAISAQKVSRLRAARRTSRTR
jgi:hypothetical protein